MSIDKKVQIIIAHYGLNRKITQTECNAALEVKDAQNIFIDFDAGHAELGELYDLPFENIALMQQRKYVEVLKPLLEKYPTAHIAYFGLTPIPVAFHLGYLVGNTHSYTIYQWHHQRNEWFYQIDPPSAEYKFNIKPIVLPTEMQKGKGDVVIRISTSFNIDRQTTYQVISNPANEFDIELSTTHVDALYSQSNIQAIVAEFQEVLNVYANKLTDRDQIHLFISSSAGLPFALGTRINTNIYPYVQTYQFDKKQTPPHREAILITKEISDRVILTDDERVTANKIRMEWEIQLQDKIKPFIKTITGMQPENWLQTVCENLDDYRMLQKHLCSPWDKIIDINATSLKEDAIDLKQTNIDGGFEYIEKTGLWILDDGFMSGLKKRLDKNINTDLMQAGRLFFFHEALHYSKSGHRLVRQIATGIGQFPKVIEEADYQADAWALLNEYRYCSLHEPQKLRNGLKQFFCNAIDTAVETMWSFVDTGTSLNTIQIRAMNRFLNWYWQWICIEDLDGKGTLEQVVSILFNKPVIEFAGAPIELRAHRTYFKLNSKNPASYQLAAFVKNKVHRFAPAAILDIVEGFRNLNGKMIKEGLKSFQVNIG
ncbi:MAG: SAVED domain-containing protein [Ginsengibacter sp.]